MFASLVRTTFTGSLVFIVAIISGMEILGSGVDLFGLVGLALTVNVAATLFGCGVAMLLRTQQAGPLIQTPIFMLLFLAPVYVPLELLEGWLKTVASLNPLTAIITTGRSFIAGDPTGVPTAFLTAASLVIIFLIWAYLGLRSAERSG